jgi:hypothetical protein
MEHRDNAYLLSPGTMDSTIIIIIIIFINNIVASPWSRPGESSRWIEKKIYGTLIRICTT